MGAKPSSSSTPVSLPSSSSPSSVPSTRGLRKFSLAEIRKATKNFDMLLLLGRGWISEVYKGTYDDYDGKPRTIAIKVFKLESLGSTWEDVYGKYWDTLFKRRLEVWAQYRHEHINMVIGYCLDYDMIDSYIVVYEHVANGSLAQNLCKKIIPNSFSLSWKQCLHIFIDVARGLEFMHNNIRYSNGDQFIFCDVAATNILLDDNGVAMISDLCYEPLRGLKESPTSTYDPETDSTSVIFYQSSDVYAFGVLLIKVLSRKVSFDKEDTSFGLWFKKSIVNGTIQDQIIHPEMKAEISPDCLKALLDIACECLNSKSKNRPSITQVVKKLEILVASSSPRSCDRYSFQEIREVTNNFEIILGQGGEGTVYKGVTKTNTSIAVKCLKPNYSSEFEKEINMLSDLDHPNFVSLIGYCHESDQKILIYEFMSNGNLAQSLYNTTNPLLWMQCLKVCIGAAHGLRYLHNRSIISKK